MIAWMRAVNRKTDDMALAVALALIPITILVSVWSMILVDLLG